MPKLKGTTFHATLPERSDIRGTSVSPEKVRARIIRGALRELHGTELVYAVRLPDGIIKIGWTKDFNARRRAFTSDYDAILAVMPGTFDDEQAIHARLAQHVARGREYYHPHAEVLACVNELRSKVGVDPLAA